MQTRTWSLIEVLCSIAIGAVVALASQIVIFPMFGIHVDMKTNLWITAWFTLISVVRSYFVRRLFNSFRPRAAATPAPAGPACGSPYAPYSFDLVKHLYVQMNWSRRTFGPGARVDGVCDHIRKELLEVQADAAAGSDTLREWIDVILLALDGAWRCGAGPRTICEAIADKLNTNQARTWPDWRTADPTKAIEHDRSGEPRMVDAGL